MPEVIKQKIHIKKLVLRNYKKFQDVSVEFSQGLNVLVGQNNAGKTSILEALDILLGERNLSPLAIKRSYFNKFKTGEHNLIKLILEIDYPINCGANDNEVSFIKQLKTGKGTSRSKLARLERTSHITVDELLSGTTNNNDQWLFEDNTAKTGYSINNIFLVTEITISSDYKPEVSYDIYINLEMDIENGQRIKCCYKIIGITGTQRSSIFNYLFMPANRINNKSLSEITEFNWLGRYIKSFVIKNNYKEVLSKYADNNSYPSEILDPHVQNTLNKLFTEHEKITIDLINKEDSDTVITNSRFYIKDGFNDELVNKAHGLQSASIISLFAGWCKFQASKMPKNTEVADMWNTVLMLEEPESHFHYPVKNKLLRLLKEDFIDQGAQVIISTHDNTFINWQYINSGNLIFPNSLNDNEINSLNLKKISDEYTKRIIRFNGNSFFTDVVMIVEGQEEICLDILYQSVSKKSLQEEGIILTRVVGGVRSGGTETSDLIQAGGKDDVPLNIEFFKKLKIQPMCIVDIDVLFNDGITIKNIYKKLTGNDLILSSTYICNTQSHYLRLGKWWESNKNNQELKNDLKKLSEVGIFIFPGDFEALFTDKYLKHFEKIDKPSKLIKEKFTYETKYQIEINPDGFIENLSETGKSYLIDSIKNISEFIRKKRLEASRPIIDQTKTTSEPKSKESGDDIPF